MSIDSQKIELEKLQGDMVALKEEHSTALKKKAEEFERWIGQKEQAIEEEVERRKDVEKELETARVEAAELKKQLEQKDSKITSLEDVVVEPARKHLIPHFDKVKEEALKAGALGAGISGSGPTIFAICQGDEVIN